MMSDERNFAVKVKPRPFFVVRSMYANLPDEEAELYSRENTPQNSITIAEKQKASPPDENRVSHPLS